MIKVLFLIPSLDAGGAERQLLELVRGMDKRRFAVTLAVFYAGGALLPEAEALPGVSVLSLRKRGPRDVLPFLWRLLRLARRLRPHIVHGYMNLASNVAWLVGRLAGARVVWSLRSSNVDYGRYPRGMLWSFRLGAWLSRRANLIIVNSQAGGRYHSAHGYSRERMMVVPNGIDTDRFRPRGDARQGMRARWGLPDREFAIGLVGRIDPMKDHPTFLRAAAELVPQTPGVRFVCVGGGEPGYLAQLRALAAGLGLAERVLWTGPESDMPAAYNALDLLTSSSSGEGFSNAIAEAMACGVPCVVTDVGDSALIVGDTGVLVPPNDPAALAQAWRDWLDLPEAERQARSAQARLRVEGEFGLDAMVARTQVALEGLAAPPPGSSQPLRSIDAS
jgi:glycosyltransferase involved in cell wall biosynthesis